MKINNIEILVTKGDITEADVQAIVNAANNKLVMGGGVAGVIKKKGGRIIEQEAVKQGPVDAGSAVLTSAGSLKQEYVIHVATMTLDFKTSEEIIRKASYNALLCAQKNNIFSLAFCALGCGTGGFSYSCASKIIAQEIFRYIRETKRPVLKKIVFVLYSQGAFEIFEQNVRRYLEYMTAKLCEGPFVTVDGIVEYNGGIIMVERSNPPLGWALPGGFVDYGESVEGAVAREIKEETNLDFLEFKQFKVYSQPDRDPRFHTVSVVFVGKGKGTIKADSDASDAKVFKLDFLPEKIAFDHREIIKEYKKTKN